MAACLFCVVQNRPIDRVLSNHKLFNMLPRPINLHQLRRTHQIWVVNQFKPHIQTASQYYKVLPQRSPINFGESITFDLPHVGDYVSDVVLRVSLKSVSAGLQTLTPEILKELEHPRLSLVDFTGNPIGLTYKNLVKYCDYPGERLIKSAEFSINNNVLSRYTTDLMVFKRQNLSQNRLNGYKQLVGQEIVWPASGAIRRENLDLNQYQNSANVTDNIKDPKFNIWSRNNYPQQTFRKKQFMLNGLQTPKYKHEPTELWIPLHFWFCSDVAKAYPIMGKPKLQINLDFNKQNKIIYECPNLQVKQLKGKIYTFRQYFEPKGVSKSNLNLELYVNYIFIDPQIKSILCKQISTTLVRIYKTQTLNASQQTKLNFKTPVESLMIGLQPLQNNTATDWHKYKRNVLIDSLKTTYELGLPLIDHIKLETDCQLIQNHSTYFLENYIANLNKKSGIILIRFNLAKTPSGYLNFSQLNSLILKWDLIETVRVVIIAQTINFLIIKNNNAALKFSV